MHIEAIFLATVGVCCIMACIVPGTELWFACRPIREDYKPCRHPEVLAFLLAAFVFVLGYVEGTIFILKISWERERESSSSFMETNFSRSLLSYPILSANLQSMKRNGFKSISSICIYSILYVFSLFFSLYICLSLSTYIERNYNSIIYKKDTYV